MTLKSVIYCFHLEQHDKHGFFCLKFLHILACSLRTGTTSLKPCTFARSKKSYIASTNFGESSFSKYFAYTSFRKSAILKFFTRTYFYKSLSKIFNIKRKCKSIFFILFIYSLFITIIIIATFYFMMYETPRSIEEESMTDISLKASSNTGSISSNGSRLSNFVT